MEVNEMTNDEPTPEALLRSIVDALTSLADAIRELHSAHYVFREEEESADLKFVPSDLAKARAALLPQLWNPMLTDAIKQMPAETIAWVIRALGDLE